MSEYLVPAAFVLLLLAIALTATWRVYLKPRWATLTWTPRLTPGIRAEILMVMGSDGKISILSEKLAPEENPSEIFALFTEQWFAFGAQILKVTLNVTTPASNVQRIDTPTGPMYRVDLVRPVDQATLLRAMTDEEETLAHAAD
jgi:hypothetical protein